MGLEFQARRLYILWYFAKLKLHFSHPINTRYLYWMGNFWHGRFGRPAVV